MRTELAFMMGEANRDKELMVFDWDKAAKILKDRKPIIARAGLHNDMEWTDGVIWEYGKPTNEDYTYLSSTWVTPVLELDYDEEIPCYKMEHETSWNCDTQWPETALDIVGQKIADEVSCDE